MKKISHKKIYLVIIIIVSIFASSILIDLYNTNTKISVLMDKDYNLIDDAHEQYEKIDKLFDELGKYNEETSTFIINDTYKNNNVLTEREDELTTLYRQLILEDYGQKSMMLKLYEQNLDEISCDIHEVDVLICDPDKDYSLIDYNAILDSISDNIPTSYVGIFTENMKLYLFNNYRQSNKDNLFNVKGKIYIKEDYIEGLIFHISVLEGVAYYLDNLYMLEV